MPITLNHKHSVYSVPDPVPLLITWTKKNPFGGKLCGHIKLNCSCLATICFRWEGEALNHQKNTTPCYQAWWSIMLWGCFAASGFGVSTGQWSLIHINSGQGMNKSGYNWGFRIAFLQFSLEPHQEHVECAEETSLCQEANKCSWTSLILLRGVVKISARGLPEGCRWLSQATYWGKYWSRDI